jgi:hypothetical protein
MRDTFVPVDIASSQQPFSAGHTARRLQDFLSQTLDKSQWNSSVRPFVSAVSTPCQSSPMDASIMQLGTRSLEAPVIAAFWITLHGIFPVTMKSEFDRFYSSLWKPAMTVNGWKVRQQSALVDSIMAITLQSTRGRMPSSDRQVKVNTDVAAGEVFPAPVARYLAQEYMNRSHQLLQVEWENPTSFTFQTCIYQVVYLYHGSLFNAAHHLIALTASLARSRHVHMPPDGDAPPIEVEIENRLWAVLYQLDSIISIALGRFSVMNTTNIMNLLSANFQYEIDTAGPQLWPATKIEVTWLTFQEEHVKLTYLIRTAQDDFKTLIKLLLECYKNHTYLDPSGIVERSASSVPKLVNALMDWRRDLPNLLKFESEDEDEHHVDRPAPLWVKLQQLQLQLSYHSLLMSTYRPFLRLPWPKDKDASAKMPYVPPLTEKLAISCLKNALALTRIISQVSSINHPFQSWPLMPQMQWEATVSIVAFLMGGYDTSLHDKARAGLELAKTSLDRMSGRDDAAESDFIDAVHLCKVEEILRDQIASAKASSPDSANPWKEITNFTPIPTGPTRYRQILSQILASKKTTYPVQNTTNPAYPSGYTFPSSSVPNQPPIPAPSPFHTTPNPFSSAPNSFPTAPNSIPHSGYGSQYASSSTTTPPSTTSPPDGHVGYQPMTAPVQYATEGMANMSPFSWPASNLNIQLYDNTSSADQPMATSNMYGVGQQTSAPMAMQSPAYMMPAGNGMMPGTMYGDHTQWQANPNNMVFNNDWQMQNQQQYQ